MHVQIDPSTENRPTWGLVVVLVLTIALETVGEWVVDAIGSAPPIPWAECGEVCEGRVGAVAPGECHCLPSTDDCES